MRYGIVDIGSNTIRAVVYEVVDDKYREVLTEKDYAELISYIEDNKLTDDGIERLCTTIHHMKQLTETLECQSVFYFATASLRNIDNAEDVMLRVYEETKENIRVITGEEEAYFDYVSLKNQTNLSEAIGLDLGGGSGQIFYYKNNLLAFSNSYAIGCLKLYNQYVKGVLPNGKERAQIIKVIKEYFKNDSKIMYKKIDVIYGMGGTARACAKLHRKLLGTDQSTDNYYLTLEDLEELDQVVSGLGLNGIKIINRIMPERLCTIIPGLIAVRTIMKSVGAKKLCVIKQGVREGFLIDQVINGEAKNCDDRRKEKYIY